MSRRRQAVVVAAAIALAVVIALTLGLGLYRQARFVRHFEEREYGSEHPFVARFLASWFEKQ